MSILVIATEKELDLPWARAYSSDKTIITGVGGTNVIRALKDLPRDSEIINVGYCGSVSYPVGTVLFVEQCRLWHPGVQFKEPSFRFDARSGVICLTAGDFVTGENIDVPPRTVFDMELAYIAAFAFSKLTAIKYVSDNCNLLEYENNTKTACNKNS